MSYIKSLSVDGEVLGSGRYSRIAATETPVLSWIAASHKPDSYQKSYRITVTCGNDVCYSSGWIESTLNRAKISGCKKTGCRYTATVEICDNNDFVSEPFSDYFYFGARGLDDAEWIAASEDIPRRAVYFNHKFNLNRKVSHAFIYVCGLGYQKVYINGIAVEDKVELAPLHSNYKKTSYYTVTPEFNGICEGENEVSIIIGDGWRRCQSNFIRAHTTGREIEFYGLPVLCAAFDIYYTDGTCETITTGNDWVWSHGPIVMNDLYDGETYDANIGIDSYQPVEVKSCPAEKLLPQTVAPIEQMEVYPAKSVFSPRPGIFVFDFGQNIAGVPRINLPSDMTSGQTIKITCHEILDEDGTLYTATLREAKCTDTYISSGSSSDLSVWQPIFTYHGFRYAQIEGWGNSVPQCEDISAVALYTNINSKSFFECGSALINKIHLNAAQTERSNIHGILTDCPQRDERMGWLNDATVRFEETPYNFDIARIFPKIVCDIIDSQNKETGAFQCTAPYVFGGNPADPVCSSFLVAGMQAYIRTGDIRVVKEGYEGWKAWENLLLSRANEDEPYIVNYSYYGDWAGPAYACITMEHAVSAVTPGIFISTGYSYLNATFLSYFAKILGFENESAEWAVKAQLIREAILKKWWNEETAVMGSGSQACQAFSLWLGLVPKDKEQDAARVMRDSLVNNDYKITTGNLCTRYLFDMLAKFGYINEAYELICREEYPSYGFMIQNEATTVWERFELKKDPGMNSHNHPMYAAVDYWFYAYLCGVTIESPETAFINPCLPEKLLSAQCKVQTIRGDLCVRWVKRFDKKCLYVTVPFGMTANITFNGKNYVAGSGWHTFID